MSPNRWRIPIGAVAVHICIGSVYAWSTFNRPIQALFPDQPWWFSPPYTTFTTALVLLGLSAAFGGPWVERRGPRVAATAAALFFGVGLIIGGLGLAIRQPVVVFLGMGVIGGIGCGLGYISPVSTLVKWFPDRRGMATGMAIMGFGGGAFLAGYLNVFFMDRIGVANTVMTLGATYLAIMLIGSRLLERPPAGWKPAGWTAGAVDAADDRGSQRHAGTRRSRRRSSSCLWGILFINVTAGIGILAQASPMMQDMFHRTALQAAAVVSLISIFNASGRFLWASGLGLHRPPQHLHDLLRRAVRPLPADSAARPPAATGACFRRACSSCSRCTAAGLPPSRRFSRTSSAPKTSARFTARC